MVNRPATPKAPRPTDPAADDGADRRGRARATSPGTGAGLLGPAKLHPFGDLHTLQHLSARLARSLRVQFENYGRGETRAWAEPLEVVRFVDYRATRNDRLTAWVQLGMNGTPALLVLDGGFVLELLDQFFGGTGVAPAELPREFTPAAEALVARIATDASAALESAWEPVSRASFSPGRCEHQSAHVAGIEGEEPVIVTRFGLARGKSEPVFLDILYPVQTLKPHGAGLTTKVVAKPAETDAEWTNALGRAAMTVRLPVRSVLAEPVVSLARLMALQPGDVIPIPMPQDVPVVVGGERFGAGTVGSSNGHAAIRLTRIEGLNP